MNEINVFDLGMFRMMVVNAGHVIYRGDEELGQMAIVGTSYTELKQQIADGKYTCELPRPEPELTEDTEDDN